MSDIKEPSIDEKASLIEESNKKAYLKFVQRFWEFDDESFNIIKNRVETNDFDPEFNRILNGSTDQRIRWDVDFSEPSLQGLFEGRDEAFAMFKRRFANVLFYFSKKYGTTILYKNFMDNKIIFKKNETKLKKVLEVLYNEEKSVFRSDAGMSSSKTVDEKIISDFIVKVFEEVGTLKKPLKKLQLVFSLNLADWLLASTGGNISSCLNMEGGGHKYWSGLGFLAGDANRGMLYISDGTKKTFEGMTVDNCMTRSWVILTATNHKSIIRWYSQDILPIESIREITGDARWRKGMDTKGKNKITPIFLKSGITTTIYVDEGCWEKSADDDGKFEHTLSTKGCYQVFTEDLNPAKNFDFSSPWGKSNDWRISSFKKNGTSINDNVPVSICSECGRKKTFVRSSGVNEPICFVCFNKKFFSCDGGCGGYQSIDSKHYDGFAVKDTKKIKVKLCNSCITSRYKTCECCGLPIISGSKSTMEGKSVCSLCVADKNNGYKECSVCGKISKNKVFKAYNELEKIISDFCSEHMISEKTDIEKNSNSFTPYFRKPAEKLYGCKKCGTMVPYKHLTNGVCYSCKEDNGSNNMEN